MVNFVSDPDWQRGNDAVKKAMSAVHTRWLREGNLSVG